MILPIPVPPPSLLDAPPPAFAVADGLSDWVREVLLDEASPIHNPEHAHLADAEIGFLWARERVTNRGRAVIGTAEIFAPRGMGWAKARQQAQVRDWFGHVPDFIVTLDAEHVADRLARDDAPAVLALLEHELTHCAQAHDEFGGPRFRRDGRPVFTIRGHDVEEFVSVVRRYGAEAAGPDVLALVHAAQQKPEVARASLGGICGTCLRLAA